MVDPNAHSATHSFHTDATANDIKDDRLIAPPQDLTATSHLIFWHKFITEDGFDGGVLEISRDGGSTWVDVLTGGGSFVAGGYNGNIDTGFDSPIAGRPAWTGQSPSVPNMDRAARARQRRAGSGRRLVGRRCGIHQHLRRVERNTHTDCDGLPHTDCYGCVYSYSYSHSDGHANGDADSQPEC
jgi:hypothetical protein